MPKRYKSSSKKAHKKIDVTQIESFVHEQLREKDVQAALAAKADSELFIDDKQPTKALGVTVKIKKPDRSNIERKQHLKKQELLAAALKEVRRPKEKKIQTKLGVYDLWGEPSKKGIVQGGADREWVEPAIKKPVLPPKSFSQRPSGLPAVEVESGESYRPTYEAHQDLLAAALAVEVRKKEKEKKWNRMLRGEKANAPKLQNVPEVDDLTKKDDTEEEEEDEEEESLDLEKKHNPYSLKLTRTQRNKMKRKQEQERERAKKLELKAQRRKFEKLPLILKELNEAEEIQAKRLQEKRERKEKKRLLATKKLGPNKFEEMKPVVLTDELPQSLRSLQPPENLFVDRYKSLQKRNMIEPRKKVSQKRKYKKKVFEKRSAKMEWEL